MPGPLTSPYAPELGSLNYAFKIADLMGQQGDREAARAGNTSLMVADLVSGAGQMIGGAWDRRDDQKAYADIARVFDSGEPFDAAELIKKYGVERTKKAYELYNSMDRSFVLNKGQIKFDRNNKAVAYGGGDEDGGISADEKGVVEDIAEAIRTGQAPPVLTGMYKLRPYVQASLARSGYNLSEAETDWKATQRYLATMNGRPMIGLLGAATTADHSLDRIDQLVTEWEKLDKSFFGGDYQLLNSATMTAAVNGQWGPEVTKIAQALRAQITDVSSELGQMYMGGTSPTDHALRMGAENLNGNWDATTLRYLIKQAKNNIRIRQNSLTQGPVGTGDNPYFTSQQPRSVDGMVEMWDPKKNRTLYVPEADVNQARIAGAVFPGSGRTPPVEGAAAPPSAAPPAGAASTPWYAPPSQQPPSAPATAAPESFQFSPQPNASSGAGARFVPPPVAPPVFTPPGTQPPVTSPSQATPPTAPPVVRPVAPTAASVAPAAAPPASIPQSSVAPDGTVAMTNPRNGRPLRVPRAEVSAALAGGAVFAPVAGGQSPVERPPAPPVQPPAVRPSATAVTAVPPAAAPAARPPVAAAPMRPQAVPPAVAGPSIRDTRRVDGTPKGDGWFGPMRRADGSTSSEISIGINIDGREVQIPTLVPTLTPQEVQWLMTNDISDPSRLPAPIVNKAVAFAVERMGQGKSPFAAPGERARPTAPAAAAAPPTTPPARRPSNSAVPPSSRTGPIADSVGNEPFRRRDNGAVPPADRDTRDQDMVGMIDTEGQVRMVPPGAVAAALNLGWRRGDIELPAGGGQAPTVGSLVGSPPPAAPAPAVRPPAAAAGGASRVPAGYVLFRDERGALRGVVKADVATAKSFGWTPDAKPRQGEHAMGILGEDLNLMFGPKSSAPRTAAPPVTRKPPDNLPIYGDKPRVPGKQSYLMQFPGGPMVVYVEDAERALAEGGEPATKQQIAAALGPRNRAARAQR